MGPEPRELGRMRSDYLFMNAGTYSFHPVRRDSLGLAGVDSFNTSLSLSWWGAGIALLMKWPL